jgi:hypothetical protein
MHPNLIKIVSPFRGCLWTGYWLVIGFIDYLCTPLGTTSNYSHIANLLNLQITRVPTNPFSSMLSSPAVPWQLLLTVEILQLHAFRFYLHSLRHRTPLDWQLCNSTADSQLTGSPQMSFLQPLCTDHVENIVSNSNSIVVEESLPSRFYEMERIISLIIRLLHSIDCPHYNSNVKVGLTNYFYIILRFTRVFPRLSSHEVL